MLAAYREGRSTINAFARIAGAEVTAIDVGVGHPTGDIRFESGADRATLRTRRADRHRRGRARSTATSSCSARWASATPRRRPRSPPRWPVARRRRGSAAAPASTTRASPASAPPCRSRSGGSPASPTRSRSCARWAVPSWSPIAAAAIAARHRSIPVVLDGYVVTAAVLPLFSARPDRARPLHRRTLLRRTGSSPVAGTAGQATAPRPRHASRRRIGRDGGGAVDRDGVCGRHRGADVRGVVRRVTRRAGRPVRRSAMRSGPRSSSRGCRSVSGRRHRSPPACRGSRSSAR